MDALDLEYFGGMLVFSGALAGFLVGVIIGKWPGRNWRWSAFKGGVVGAMLLALVPTVYIGAIGFLSEPPLEEWSERIFKSHESDRRLRQQDAEKESPSQLPVPAVVTLGGDSFGEEVLEQELPVLVVFWSSECETCKSMSPVIHGFAKSASDHVKVVRLDIDRHTDVAQKYGVETLPVLMLFQEGSLLSKKAGDVSPQQLAAWVGTELAMAFRPPAPLAAEYQDIVGLIDVPVDSILDAKNLNTPLPILRTKKELGHLGSGESLLVLYTSGDSVRDFEAFAKQTGNKLLQAGEHGEYFYAVLLKP